MSHQTITVDETPQKAPENFRNLKDRVVTADGEGLYETWHGPGEACDTPCGACQNQAGNLKIYGNWGYSYPNGNCWNDQEVLCGACGKFTYVCDFTEG